MRTSTALLGLAIIGLLSTGCAGTGSDGDDDARSADSAPPKHGTRLPVPVTSAEPGLLTVESLRDALPPEPAADAPFTEVAQWSMRRSTVAMAGIPGRTSAECEGGTVSEKPGVTTRCTVTYEGVKVPWAVRFDEPAGDLKPYDITNAGQAVLTAKSVYGNFWQTYHRTSKHLRCDRIPTRELVAYDKDTGYECQYASSTKGEARWIDVPVKVGEHGVTFDNDRPPKPS
ncbi:hypothetical protein ACIQNG_18120 [Streptomyces sp. NPDC091377]|uniref:hypothetical protein n=1 Tax=Streptomyces sp. NPDC091377 TaxID=3365995 RepID=UPI003807202F